MIAAMLLAYKPVHKGIKSAELYPNNRNAWL